MDRGAWRGSLSMGLQNRMQSSLHARDLPSYPHPTTPTAPPPPIPGLTTGWFCIQLSTPHSYFYHRYTGGCSLEGLMLKLKPQYLGHLMQRADSLEKTLMLGGIGGRRRRGRQRMRWLGGITDSMVMSLTISGSWWWTGMPGVLRFMGWQRVGHDWAELNHRYICTSQSFLMESPLRN